MIETFGSLSRYVPLEPVFPVHVVTTTVLSKSHCRTDRDVDDLSPPCLYGNIF